MTSHCDPRRVSIDVGANEGLYSFLLLRSSASVHGFEPNPDLCSVLNSCFRNNQNYVLHPYALSNRQGDAEFSVPIRGGIPLNGHGSLEHSEAGSQTFRVPLQTLDAVNVCDVAVIKIDVEGHELSVLEGAQGLLEREHPALLVEAMEGDAPGQVKRVSDYLASFGYVGAFFLGGHLRPISEFRSDMQVWGKRPYVGNFLFE